MKSAEFWSGIRARITAYPDGAAFVAGLVLFGLGLGLAWPPLGLIGTGAILMAVSVFGGGRKA